MSKNKNDLSGWNSEGSPGQGGPTRTVEMPDIFGGADKKTRPASVTILADQGSVFSLVRDFSRWPSFMKHLTRVEQISPTNYRWTAGHGGNTTQWETEVLEEIPGQLIAWRTTEDSPFRQTAAIILDQAVGGRGTILSFKMNNESVLADLIGFASKLTLKDPDSEALDTVRRLKALIETGEVPTVEGQPSGREEDQKEQVA